jgi:hypothetical protein
MNYYLQEHSIESLLVHYVVAMLLVSSSAAAAGDTHCRKSPLDAAESVPVEDFDDQGHGEAVVRQGCRPRKEVNPVTMKKNKTNVRRMSELSEASRAVNECSKVLTRV